MLEYGDYEQIAFYEPVKLFLQILVKRCAHSEINGAAIPI